MGARYVVAHSYRSSTAVLEVGAVVELDDELAAWLLLDSPGVITPEADPVADPEDAPADPEADPAADPAADAPAAGEPKAARAGKQR